MRCQEKERHCDKGTCGGAEGVEPDAFSRIVVSDNAIQRLDVDAGR